MGMNNLLIFDKDSTLTTPRSGAKFVQHPEDQILLPNVAETIARYRGEGWDMAIASNQDGCDSINHKTGKPFKSVDEAQMEMRFAMDIANVGRSVFCPSMIGSSMCQVLPGSFYCHTLDTFEWDEFKGFRKPDPGMLLWLKAGGNYDRVLFVGDRPEDERAAIAAGAEFQWAKDFFGWNEYLLNRQIEYSEWWALNQRDYE